MIWWLIWLLITVGIHTIWLCWGGIGSICGDCWLFWVLCVCGIPTSILHNKNKYYNSLLRSPFRVLSSPPRSPSLNCTVEINSCCVRSCVVDALRQKTKQFTSGWRRKRSIRHTQHAADTARRHNYAAGATRIHSVHAGNSEIANNNERGMLIIAKDCNINDRIWT
jgi:hypothetical protein